MESLDDNFQESNFQGLRDFGERSHTLESDASSYLTKNILISRKVDLLEINKEQLARNGHEMTELLDAVDLPSAKVPKTTQNKNILSSTGKRPAAQPLRENKKKNRVNDLYCQEDNTTLPSTPQNRCKYDLSNTIRLVVVGDGYCL